MREVKGQDPTPQKLFVDSAEKTKIFEKTEAWAYGTCNIGGSRQGTSGAASTTHSVA
jgi:hypothetical protein